MTMTIQRHVRGFCQNE